MVLQYLVLLLVCKEVRGAYVSTVQRALSSLLEQQESALVHVPFSAHCDLFSSPVQNIECCSAPCV